MADVVEVVRCVECQYWGDKYASDECSLITQLANPDYWLKTAPNDFCSSGKRRVMPMNKHSSLIRKLGAILQIKKATKEEVKEAYKNSGLVSKEEVFRNENS